MFVHTMSDLQRTWGQLGYKGTHWFSMIPGWLRRDVGKIQVKDLQSMTSDPMLSLGDRFLGSEGFTNLMRLFQLKTCSVWPPVYVLLPR